MLEKNKMTVSFIVERQHLAIEIGSGTIAVLGTPALIGFMETVANRLVQKDLSPDTTSVGIFIEMEHLYPCKIGEKVEVQATITTKTEKIVELEIVASCNEKIIGKAKHKRAIIIRKQFLEKYNILK